MFLQVSVCLQVQRRRCGVEEEGGVCNWAGMSVQGGGGCVADTPSTGK